MSGREEDVKRALWERILRINQACTRERGFEELADLFHSDTVLAYPGFERFAQGRDSCLALYRDACSQMTVLRMAADRERIDVFGPLALACYRYDCEWEFQGKRIRDLGHEVLAFIRSGEDWQVAWRSVIPARREGELITSGQAEDSDATGSDSADIRQRCYSLMESAEVCMLTTIDSEGFPQTTAMYNLRNPARFPCAAAVHRDSTNPFQLYLTTGASSEKIARLETNPKAAVYYCDPRNLFGLMLGGEVEVVTDRDLKRRIWQEGWTVYYPGGPDGPEYAVISLAPRVVRGWSANGGFELTC